MDRRTSGKDPLGNMTSYVFDTTGALNNVVEADGNMTTSTHDFRGRRADLTDQLGRNWEYVDDCGGNVMCMSGAGSKASAAYGQETFGNARSGTHSGSCLAVSTRGDLWYSLEVMQYALCACREGRGLPLLRPQVRRGDAEGPEMETSKAVTK